MPTWSALTTLPGPAAAVALAEAMEAMDPAPEAIGVFEIEDGSGLWEVGAQFPAEPAAAALAVLECAFGARAFAVSELPEIDWVAKVRRELSPVVAGRFFVYGSHDADRVPEDALALLIEASMAFGTGHHGTTLGCLRALDRLAAAGVAAERIVDIGCGTAVLAMAAAKLWGRPVLASDIDAVAVEVARANVAANRLDGLVTCAEAAGLDHPALAAAAPFDLVFANILMGPLIDLAPALAAAVGPGGRAILSGLLNDQAGAVLGAYDAQGMATEHREEVGEWTTLTLRHPN